MYYFTLLSEDWQAFLEYFKCEIAYHDYKTNKQQCDRLEKEYTGWVDVMADGSVKVSDKFLTNLSHHQFGHLLRGVDDDIMESSMFEGNYKVIMDEKSGCQSIKYKTIMPVTLNAYNKVKERFNRMIDEVKDPHDEIDDCFYSLCPAIVQGLQKAKEQRKRAETPPDVVGQIKSTKNNG